MSDSAVRLVVFPLPRPRRPLCGSAFLVEPLGAPALPVCVMFSRTYSPLPAWPIAALATALFLAPGRRLGLALGVLTTGYVLGPLAARIVASQAMRAVDENLAELPDD